MTPKTDLGNFFTGFEGSFDEFSVVRPGKSDGCCHSYDRNCRTISDMCFSLLMANPFKSVMRSTPDKCSVYMHTCIYVGKKNSRSPIPAV